MNVMQYSSEAVPAFQKGQKCVFRNRHSSGMSHFDNKECEVVECIPGSWWIDKSMPEYWVRFPWYRGRISKIKVEENELEHA